MKKKIVIRIDMEDLKSPTEEKNVLINLRVDAGLYRAFKEVCEKEVGRGMSDVIRKMMKELCLQTGYL